MRWVLSHDNQGKSGINRTQIIRIRSDHGLALLPCMQRHVNIHDVRMPGSSTQQPNGSGRRIVQRRHVHRRITQQASHTRLPGPATPRLRHNASGH